MKKYFFILTIIIFSFAFSNSRISFIRPGSFMRVSDLDRANQNKLFSISLASEVTSIGDILSQMFPKTEPENLQEKSGVNIDEELFLGSPKGMLLYQNWLATPDLGYPMHQQKLGE